MSSSTMGSAAWRAENKGPVIITTCWTFSVLSTVFVAGRLWVRGSVWKKIQLDDHLVVAALVRAPISSPDTFVRGSHLLYLILSSDLFICRHDSVDDSGFVWQRTARCPSHHLPTGKNKLLYSISILSRIAVLWTAQACSNTSSYTASESK